MRPTAVPATWDELAPSAGRAIWDREVLYRSMIRWGNGSVVPITSRPAGRTMVRRLARGISAVVGRQRGKRGWIAQGMRDFSQVSPVHPPRGVEVLYGHIVFPVSRGLPTVWSSNGVFDARPGMWFPDQSARTHARLIARAARVQVWSHLGLQGVLERVDVDTDKIEVIPPLVYVDMPQPFARHHDDVTALFIGAIGELKGLDVVLDAWSGLGAGIRLEVITNSPRPPDLPGSVEWLGPRPREEVLARLASADIHVCPSTTESFGGVVVEAMAAGVSQVVDGESVTAEVAGGGALRVPGRDPSAVAEAVERLAADSGMRGSLGRAGRDRYDLVYSPDAVGPRLAALIDEA